MDFNKTQITDAIIRLTNHFDEKINELKQEQAYTSRLLELILNQKIDEVKREQTYIGGLLELILKELKSK